ncbi:ferredoxin--NADP reductase [Actinomadura sp. GC306]|uniref:ferredoxin--NADP reductase n=1 Tax=Actinomadura sp. GC306 TaxID=2530367 RepID=UPI00104E81F4|nr:ferredoxin--NADP reductase [Actinomadura sp. GC306]TDC71548.1 ferredoxin--NADP reductase [Actinomadura sp. GC306]
MTDIGACTVTVLDVIEETRDARSLVLEAPEDVRDRFGYRPGQFLTLRIPAAGGSGTARCYSLSSAPGVDPHMKITVKRVSGGTGSNWICDHVRPGDTLQVLPPAGLFTPERLDGRLFLFAGGSGITPVMSIIKAVLARPEGSAVLCYANRDESSVIFAAELRRLVERHPGRLQVVHWLESVQGLPTAAALAALAAPHADRDAALVCGPEPFMDAVADAMRDVGLPRERVIVERFHSLTGDPFAEPEPLPAASGGDAGARVTVTLDGERHSLPWPSGTPLLDVLLANGIRAPFSCREGACSACACQVVSGEVKMLRNDVLEEEDLAEGWVLGCQSLPVTEDVEVTYD